MRFLVTRPIDASESIARQLRHQKYHAFIDPLMTVECLPKHAFDLSDYQALIFTSSNGVQTFKEKYHTSNITVFTVGNKTAKTAKAIGFNDVISADGDVDKLSETLIRKLDPTDGPLLYLSGMHIAKDLNHLLQQAEFTIDKFEIYQIIPANGLSEETKQRLKEGEIDFIPFYSPQSALIFMELVNKAGLQRTLAPVTALCLSAAVSDVLESSQWKEVLTAQKPTQYDLFKVINIEL